MADGAARQAAWVVLGGENPPEWTLGETRTCRATPTPAVREAYARARELATDRR